MRPCCSSSVNIEGMLFSTLILRRLDQKPSVMVTARTGTLRSFAYGEFTRFSTPWSLQGIAVAAASKAALRTGFEVRVFSTAENAGRANKVAAVEVTAVERKRRREKSFR